MPDETYLGDGLYASLELGQIKVRAGDERAKNGDHVIYLDPETYAALRAYARKIGFPGEAE